MPVIHKRQWSHVQSQYMEVQYTTLRISYDIIKLPLDAVQYTKAQYDNILIPSLKMMVIHEDYCDLHLTPVL